MKQTIKINKNTLTQIISESIEKYLHANSDVSSIVSNHFSLPPAYRTALFEAAFQFLGYERFAIDGEIGGDEPWDDTYSIINWAVNNKGLDKHYLGKVSEQYSNMSHEAFQAYSNAVQCGKEFWFTKEELAEILKILPQQLKVNLMKDMLNVGRIQKIYDTVNYMATLNGGKNLEEFIDLMREKMKGQKWNRKTLYEPVKEVLTNVYMLK